jgi:hypothetical protein
MVVGYIYDILRPKIYKTEITIPQAPSSLFDAYRFFFSKQQQGFSNSLTTSFN